MGIGVERFILSPKSEPSLCPPNFEMFVPYCIGTTRDGGNHYHGGLSYGIKDGVGTYKSANGDMYTGEFRGGMRHGKGTYTWADGQQYEGNWLFGNKEGKGTLSLKNKYVFHGIFSNDKPSEGETTYSNGTVVIGTQKNWQHDGEVLIKFADGGSGSAIYRDGKRVRGIKKDSTGSIIYDGEYADEKYHGKGKLNLNDGNTYEGDFIAGVREGRGTYTYADGRKYEGEFKSNQFNGHGTMTNPDGTTASGNWIDGKLVEH